MNMVKHFRNLLYNSQAAVAQDSPDQGGKTVTPQPADSNIANDGLVDEEEQGREDGFAPKHQIQMMRNATDTDKLNSINEKILEIQETMNTFASHVFEQEMKTSESRLTSTKDG